jgi:hypothetical protein
VKLLVRALLHLDAAAANAQDHQNAFDALNTDARLACKKKMNDHWDKVGERERRMGEYHSGERTRGRQATMRRCEN